MILKCSDGDRLQLKARETNSNDPELVCTFISGAREGVARGLALARNFWISPSSATFRHPRQMRTNC